MRSRPLEDLRHPRTQIGTDAFPRCRICWNEFDDIDDTYGETFIAPCECKGTMVRVTCRLARRVQRFVAELRTCAGTRYGGHSIHRSFPCSRPPFQTQEFVHIDCISRWSQHRHRRCRDDCDVCKRPLSYPGQRQVKGRRVWATDQLASTAVRLLQHYIVSLTLMGGLETAVNSIMASVVAYKQQQHRGAEASANDALPNSHLNNLVKALMGISIARTVVCRRIDLVGHLASVRRLVSWGGRLIGRVVSERLVL